MRLQISTACYYGMYCPSFSQESIEELPDGFYSLYGFDATLCPKGYYCTKGQVHANCVCEVQHHALDLL